MADRSSLREASEEASFWVAVALVSIAASVLFKVLAAQLPENPTSNAIRELAGNS